MRIRILKQSFDVSFKASIQETMAIFNYEINDLKIKIKIGLTLIWVGVLGIRFAVGVRKFGKFGT